jgi:16S rRNA (cytidine1402-2'-O)-methyltransferase
MCVLYVVATPIGNLEDVTLRALRILREVTLIAAEDTRTTAKLLARYEIHTPMVSFFEHNEVVRQDEILQAVENGDVALVSEAGMPTISDPGYRLVQEAIGRGVCVIAVPGPSAVLAALVVSGLPTDRFLFLGFLPRRQAARKQQLASVRDQVGTVVCFEAPHRLVAALRDIYATLGDRQIAVACELTKLYEQVWRGSVSGALDHFSQTEPRGEFTLVLAGASGEEETAWEEALVRKALAEVTRNGLSWRDAAAEVAEMARWPKRTVYRLAIEERTQHESSGEEDA